MSLRFREIAESNLTIQIPLYLDKLLLLGRACGLKEGMNVLDLSCGKGEALSQWASHYEINGVGVDSSFKFIADAQKRAYMLDVGNKITFIQGDAVDYPQEHHQFDVVTCLHLISDTLESTIELMRTALKDGGKLIVGDAFWISKPTEIVYNALNVLPETFSSLGDLLDRFDAMGFELVEMALATHENLDEYETSQWQAVTQFIDDNPNDSEALTWQNAVSENKRSYLHFGRQYMGWGAFVLKQSGIAVSQIPVTVNSNQPVAVDFAEGMLWVRLTDGRVIGNPIEWYPWLQSASTEDRHNMEFTSTGVTWHSLKQHLDVADILAGKV